MISVRGALRAAGAVGRGGASRPPRSPLVQGWRPGSTRRRAQHGTSLLNHLLACLVGKWTAESLSPELLRWALGISFLAVAVWALIPDKLDTAVTTRGSYGVFMVAALAFFLAEMGDKTQILALTLAAKYDDLLQVVAGTTLGMMIVNIPTVLFAERATKWLPLPALRMVAAAICAVLGVITLSGHSRVL